MKIIYENPDGGVSVVIPAPGVDPANLISRVVPYGASWDMVADTALPSDRLFRDALRKSGSYVVENLAASKVVAHEIRRRERAAEFAPHDEVISLQIPGSALADAETARATIRTKYETIQNSIDAATTVAEIRTALDTI